MGAHNHSSVYVHSNMKKGEHILPNFISFGYSNLCSYELELGMGLQRVCRMVEKFIKWYGYPACIKRWTSFLGNKVLF